METVLKLALSENPEDRFSRDIAHFNTVFKLCLSFVLWIKILISIIRTDEQISYCHTMLGPETSLIITCLSRFI